MMPEFDLQQKEASPTKGVKQKEVVSFSFKLPVEKVFYYRT